MHRPRFLLLLPALLALGACAAPTTPSASTPTTASPTSTSDVEAPASAEEVAGAVATLTSVVDGDVVVGETSLGAVDSPTDIAADGRFVAIATADGVTIIDAGSWTEPHGDHSHSFVAEPAVLGTTALDAGALTMHASTTLVAIRSDAGDAVVLDRAALEDGEVLEVDRIDTAPGPGALVPALGGLVLVDADGVAMLGEAREHLADCVGLGAVSTSAGVAAACDDAVLLLTGTEVVSMPAPAPISAITNRGTRPLVTLVGGDQAWTLDLREGAWTPIEADLEVAAALAIDDDPCHVLVVGDDGALVVLDEDGVVLDADLGTAASLAFAADRGEAHVVTADGHLVVDLADDSHLWTPIDGIHVVTGL